MGIKFRADKQINQYQVMYHHIYIGYYSLLDEAEEALETFKLAYKLAFKELKRDKYSYITIQGDTCFIQVFDHKIQAQCDYILNTDISYFLDSVLVQYKISEGLYKFNVAVKSEFDKLAKKYK